MEEEVGRGGSGETPALGDATSHSCSWLIVWSEVVEDATTGGRYCKRYFEMVNLEPGAIVLSACCEMENVVIQFCRWPWATEVYAPISMAIGSV